LSIATFINVDVVGGIVIRMAKKQYRQRGRSNKAKDKKRRAKAPGWRKAKPDSEPYFENRRNRSDRGKWI